MNTLLTSIQDIAEGAGHLLLDFHAKLASLDIKQKPDKSPVSEADVAAHHHIYDALTSLTPEIPIISEEGHIPTFEEREAWSQCWLVDPLDGTKSFLRGEEGFSVLIALVENNEPILGCIYFPYANRFYVAEKNQGAYKIENGIQTKIETRQKPANEVTVTLTHACNISNKRKKQIAETDELSLIEQASAIKFGLIAEGVADLYVKKGPTSEWDTAAGQIILTEAGGNISDFHGRELMYNARDTLENPSFIAVGDTTVDWLNFLGETK